MGRRKLIEDDALLAKARAVFVRFGVTASSREVARRVGVSSSVLFQRFGSMEELVFAAMAPPAPDLSALLQREVAASALGAHLEDVALGLLAYFRELVPVLLPLATHRSFDYESFRRRHPDAPFERLTADLIAAWQRRQARGEIDCPDVGALVLNLVSVAHSLAVFERIGAHSGKFSEPTVRELARLLWRGIAPAGKSRSHSRGARVR